MENADALFAQPCFPSGFPVAARHSMSYATLVALRNGFVLTLAQIALAVLLLAPPGPLSYRYQTLVQHDSYWFANIVDRGYQTTVPPVSHKMMEVSNVAFFPAYPLLAGLLQRLFRFSTENALLLAAHAAAWLFWSYVFLFATRWQISPAGQWLGAAAIVAHPGAFFLIAAYSESLFLAALLGFLYWTTGEGPRQRFVGAIHGIVMSATRIVGLPCALIPLGLRVVQLLRGEVRPRGNWRQFFLLPGFVSAIAMLGGLAFFLFGQYRWGRWDIYMLTQQFGWGIEPDYLAVFRPASYRWLIPSLANPTEMSQAAMTVGGVLLLIMGILEFLPQARRSSGQSVRIGLLGAAAIIYFVSVSGVACVAMESMLRYEFCAHALIVLALLHYLANVPVRLGLEWVGAAAALLGLAGITLQGWYIWNFTRGNWVA